MSEAAQTARLRIARRHGAWWILGGGDDAGDIGPYATRREAEEDRRGLERTARYGHRRSFWTCEK